MAYLKNPMKLYINMAKLNELNEPFAWEDNAQN